MIFDMQILNKWLQKLHYLLAKILESKIIWTAHLWLRKAAWYTLCISYDASFSLRAPAMEATYSRGKALSSHFLKLAVCGSHRQLGQNWVLYSGSWMFQGSPCPAQHECSDYGESYPLPHTGHTRLSHKIHGLFVNTVYGLFCCQMRCCK